MSARDAKGGRTHPTGISRGDDDGIVVESLSTAAATSDHTIAQSGRFAAAGA
jgi:hypothetical protein